MDVKKFILCFSLFPCVSIFPYPAFPWRNLRHGHHGEDVPSNMYKNQTSNQSESQGLQNRRT
jgi:hypothetical protein